MKAFSLSAGENHIDDGYGHIARINAGRVVSVEVYSQSPGDVTITLKVSGFDKEQSVATITVGSDGYGVATSLNRLFAYGDCITVSGDPVEGNNRYSVRCFYE